MPTRTKRKGWAVIYSGENVSALGVKTTFSSADYSAVGLCSVTTSSNIPDWKQRISRGESATTGLEGTSYEAQLPYGWFKGFLTDSPFAGEATGELIPYALPTVDMTISDTADRIARSKLLASYMKGRSEFRGGNFLAEIVETVHMFAHPVKNIGKFFTTFVKACVNIRRYYRDPVKYARLLGQAWLTFAFGVKPLMADAADAARAVAKLTQSGRFDAFPVSGKGKEQILLSHAKIGWSLPLCNLANTWFYDRDETVLRQVKYYGMVKAEPAWKGDLATFGLGVFDFIPAVWEAIPFSFFVDYFINVQEQLDAIRLVDVEPAWLNSGIKNLKSRTYSSPYGAAVTANVRRSGGCGKAVTSAKYVKRTSLGTMPYPKWQLRLPKFMQRINIAALTTQVKYSRPPRLHR